MAGVNVIVSGGGTIVATVDGRDSANVTVGGGIGPAAVVNTAGVIVGVNPVFPTGGTNITVSGSTASYTISGPPDAYISSKSPVQSVQGKTGNVSIVATDITAGVFDVARIPVLPSQNQVISTGGISSVTPTQQDSVAKGTIVTTVDGRRWVYSGAGVKTNESSYVELADVTPEWGVIANKPSTFSPGVHSHNTTDITNLAATIQAFANVVSVQGRTGNVVVTLADVSAAPSSHTHSTTSIVGLTTTIRAVANVASVQGRTGDVVLTIQDLTAAASSHTHSYASVSHTHDYVLSVNEATGNLVLQAGSNVSISRNDNTITITASNANTAAVSAVLWPAFILGG